MNRLLTLSAFCILAVAYADAGTLADFDYSRPTVTAPLGDLDVFSGGRADAALQSRLTEATLAPIPQPTSVPLPPAALLLIGALGVLAMKGKK